MTTTQEVQGRGGGNRDVDALGQLWLLKREGSSAFVIREFSNSRKRELSMELEFSYAKLRQISITRIRAWQNKYITVEGKTGGATEQVTIPSFHNLAA